MSETNNLDNAYLDNAIGKIVDAAATKVYNESQSGSQNASGENIQSVQQETLAIIAKTNAQKALNEEMKNGISVEELLRNKLNEADKMGLENPRPGRKSTPKASSQMISQLKEESYDDAMQYTTVKSLKGLQNGRDVTEGQKMFMSMAGADSALETAYAKYQKFIEISREVAKLDKGSFTTFSDLAELKRFEGHSKGIGRFGVVSPNYLKNVNGEDVIINGERKITGYSYNGGSGILGELGNLKFQMTEYEKIINDETKSYAERAEAARGAKSISDEFDSTLSELTKKIDGANTAFKNFDVEPDKKYDINELRHKMFRNKKEQAAFMKMDPDAADNVLSLKNFKNAARRTAFNQSLGYRQRGGLVGFASNIGFNASGVGLSLGLGAFATAVKKGTEAVIKFSKASLESFGEIQSIKTNLGIVYGTQSQADQTFNQIAQYSIKSPFGVQTVSEYAVLLKQSGIYASDLMDTLKQIGDVAGGNQQKFQNIANSFAQIEANGKATTRQLRQFATAGLPIYKELTKAYEQVTGQSVSIEQIRKLTENGKISSNIVEKAFANMTGPGGTFEGAVEKGAKTYKARQQNLEDARQLAQSAYGEWLLGFGGNGRGNSLGENWISFKEDFWQGFEDWVTVKNIEESVRNIEKKDIDRKKLEEELRMLEASGASEESIRYKREQIKELDAYISEDKKRAIAMTRYESGIGRYSQEQIVSDEEYKRLKAESSKNYNLKVKTDKNGINRYFRNEDPLIDAIQEQVEITYEEYKTILQTFTDASMKIDSVISESDYNKGLKNLGNMKSSAMVGYGIQMNNTANETLDKAINKNSKGLYAVSQAQNEKYKQTAKGKLEQTTAEKSELRKAQEKYDVYSTMIDESGNLINGFKGTMKDVIEMMQSGIITPLEQIDISPEKISNDSTTMSVNPELREEERLQRSEDWKTYLKNLEQNSMALLSTGVLDERDTALIKELINEIYYNPTGNIKVLRTNDRANVEKIGALTGKIAREGSGALSTVVGASATKRTKTGRPMDIQEEDGVYPLWQRIINSSLGVSLDHFKNGTIKNGRQAFDLFDQQSQRTTIKNTFREMLNNKSFAETFGNGNIVYKTGVKTPAGNSSNLGRQQIDYKATFENVKKLSTSLSATASETRAFADSLKQQNETVKDFYVEAMTMTEEAANIYDPKYQDKLGDLFNKIEATGANAFDLGFEKVDGIYKFNEMSIEAANNWQKGMDVYIQTTEAMADFKAAVEDANIETKKNNLSASVYFGSLNGNSAFNGMKMSDKQNAMGGIFDILSQKGYEAVKVEDILNNISNATASQYRATIASKAKEPYKMTKDESEKLQKLEGLVETLTDSYESQKTPYNNKLKEYGFDTYFSNEVRTLEDARDAKLKYVDKNYKDSKEKGEAIIEVNKQYDVLKKMFEPYHNTYLKKLNAEANLNTFKNGIAIKEQESEEEKLTATEKATLAVLDYIDAQKKLTESIKAIDFAKIYAALQNGGYEEDENSPFMERRKGTYYGSSWFKAIGGGSDIYGSNTARQQLILNAAGESNKNWSEYSAKVLADKDVQNDLESYWNNMSEKGQKSFADSLKDEKGNPLGIEGFDENNLSFMDALLEKMQATQASAKGISDAAKEVSDSFASLAVNGLFDGISGTFSKLGKDIFELNDGTKDWDDELDEIGKQWKGIAQKIFESIGPQMISTGLTLAAQSAMTQNWPGVGAGLLMAGVGAASSFIGGMLEDDSKEDDKAKRIENLKDLLADLIDQAKTDAEYYQKSLRHETAIDVTHVNDAIITPEGKVISTAPDDYLIATKTPETLGAGGGGCVVNFQMIDQTTGGKVQTKSVNQKQNSDGSIDIVAIVGAIMDDRIANGDADGALAAREMRLNGQSFVM